MLVRAPMWIVLTNRWLARSETRVGHSTREDYETMLEY